MNNKYEISDSKEQIINRRLNKAGNLISEKYKLASMARKDLKYNLHFVPIYKTEDDTVYKSWSTSIYIESFYVNGVSVYAIPTYCGVSLSLAPGKYTFKVTYCIENYFEVREAKNVYDPFYKMYDNKTTYSPKKNERRTLVLEDVYIDDDKEVYLSLFVRIRAIFNEIYTRDNKLIGHEFIKYDWANGLEISSRSTIRKDIGHTGEYEDIKFCLYPYNYPLNLDYSLNKGNVKENPIVNKKINYTLTYDNVTHDETYIGEMINNKKDGLGILIDKAKGITKTIFTRYLNDDFNNYGSIIYGNGFHQFGFLEFFDDNFNTPYINFYNDGTVEYLYEHYEYNKGNDSTFRRRGIAIFKDNSVKLTQYEESGTYNSYNCNLPVEIRVPSNTYFEYKKIQSKKFTYGDYVGELENDVPHGFGALNYNNGDRYVGHFYKGKRCGIGTYYYNNGEYLHGTLDVNGYFHGQCFALKTNGTIEYKYYKFGKCIKKYWYEKDEPIKETYSTATTTNTKVETKVTPNIKTNSLESKTITNTPKDDIKCIKLSNGDEYTGSCINNVPHGTGVYNYNSGINKGSSFVGEFVNGKKEGFGTIKYKDGSYYLGNFKNDLKHGKGTFYNIDGSSEELEYDNGKIVDNKMKNAAKKENSRYKSRKSLPNGDFYSGMFLNGEFDGHGKMYYKDGSTYEGEWKNSKRHGKGIYRNTNAEYFECEFIDDVPTNHVKHKLYNGIYEGEWKDFEISGKGVFINNLNDKYEGEFIKGKITGKGVFTYHNGDKYEGDFVDGKYEGYGKYFCNGTTYEGQFKNGSLNGKGKATYADGSYYEGEFIDGKYDGYGKYISNRTTYEGQFKKGSLDGKGKVTYVDGTYVEGEFLDYLCHGKGIKLYQNGDKYEGDFINGDLTGNGTLYFVNGNKYEGEFVKGYFYGEGTFYYVNGTKLVGSFKDGKSHGVGLYYYLTGEIEEQIYDNGNLINKRILNERQDSKLYQFNQIKGVNLASEFYAGETINDIPDGLGILMYKDGGYYIGEFKNGIISGFGLYVSNEKICAGTFENLKLNNICLEITSDNKIIFGEYKNNRLNKEIIKFNSAHFKIDKERFNENIQLSSNIGYTYFGGFNALNNYWHRGGILCFNNGNKIIGQVENGFFKGLGLYIFQDGSFYVGEFENNNFNGYGILVKKDSYKVGYWKENQYIA